MQRKEHADDGHHRKPGSRLVVQILDVAARKEQKRMNVENGQLKDAEQRGKPESCPSTRKGDVRQTIPSGDHILRTVSEANITRPGVWNTRDKITITRSTMCYRY